MLEKLILENIGPAPRLAMDPLASRLNIITGDNGLGKTLLLDAAWFALTAEPASSPIRPAPGCDGTPTLSGSFVDAGGIHTFEYPFNYEYYQFEFSEYAKLPIVYAQVDGSVSVLDPARLLFIRDPKKVLFGSESPVFQFDRSQIWHGLGDDGRTLCNGLIRDWVGWQKAREPAFEMLKSALRVLSPWNEPIRPGKPVRVAPDEALDFPTIEQMHGLVPITSLSAGFRRITSLAYILVWTWVEHLLASEQRKREPAKEMIFLIDEVDSHLHPNWQRTILPSLLEVVRVLTGDAGFRVQIVANTHAPLVLASLETLFEEDKDQVFHFRHNQGNAVLDRMPFSKQGDVVGWLTSEFFGLDEARSREAERAIEAAQAFMRGEMAALPEGLRTRDQIHAELLRVLPGHDPFWPEWIVTTRTPAP